MKTILSILVLMALTACGGGTLDCNVAGACVFNVTGNTVTNSGTVAVAGGSASAPSTGASSPTTTPPPASAPFAYAWTPDGQQVVARAGDLRFWASGVLYAVIVGNTYDSQWVTLYQCSSNNCLAAGPWQAVIDLDSCLDCHMPTTKDDATIKTYLSTYIVPHLDAWIKANAGNLIGMQLNAVASGNPPATLSVIDTIAARLPEWVQVTATGAALK